MALLADAGSCHGSISSTTPLDGLCTYLQNRGVNPAFINLIGRVLWPLVLFLLVVVIARITRRLVRRAMRRSNADAQVATLAQNALLLGGYVIALGVAFVAAGLDIGVVLTLGGATSIVLGLALQDLLRNIIAGTFILVERPFRIGDTVTIDTVTGTVQSISLRTTLLRLPDGQQAILPNLIAFSNRVINATAFERRRYSVSVWIPLDVDLEAVLRAARAELEAMPEPAADPPPRIQPAVQIDGGVTLSCDYWLDYREHNADAVAALLVRRLATAVEAVQAGHPHEPPQPASRGGAVPAAEAAPPRRSRRPRAALLRRRAEPDRPSDPDAPPA
ncbi:MAG TPA: mechanosensitive ion channel family protein [Candidatus Dormibacteraeota bacterium]